jgi:signal transduction histidine kinase
VGLQRRPERGLLAGVCAGVADELDVPVLAVRAAFALAALAGGIGLVAYLLLWLLAPAAEPDPDAPPRSPWPPLAVGLLATGGAALALGPAAALILAAAAGGAALVWWAPDRAGAGGEPDRGLLRRSGGIGLLSFAAVAFIARQVGLSSLTAAVGAAAVVLGGAALVASPFILRLARDRDRERAERIAARQRAEIAAHLHDSVLQTLSLIQREHTDADTVLRLARAEERGLRTWLYGDPTRAGQPIGLADQLQDAAAAVEQSEAALIEVVTVGDLTTSSPATEAVVAATREAMLNAARHAHDPQPVQVFARITADEITVYVRDRGRGFDPGALPADRGGVRDSIVGRIARAGGSATIRSAPGAGSEIQIRMPL